MLVQCITKTWSVHSSKLTGSIMITTQVWIFIFHLFEWTSVLRFVCFLCNLKNDFLIDLILSSYSRGCLRDPNHWTLGESSCVCSRIFMQVENFKLIPFLGGLSNTHQLFKLWKLCCVCFNLYKWLAFEFMRLVL